MQYELKTDIEYDNTIISPKSFKFLDPPTAILSRTPPVGDYVRRGNRVSESQETIKGPGDLIRLSHVTESLNMVCSFISSYPINRH